MPTLNKKKLSNLELLPKPLMLSVLGFLAPKEKKITSVVSKEIKKIADTLSFGLFYMVGNTVIVGTFEDYITEVTIKPTRHVPAEEIIRSFPKCGSVELFTTFNDADRYARSLRDKILHEFIIQPAVFTVNLLQKPSPMRHISFFIPSFGSNYMKPRIMDCANSFQVDVSQVVPISGKLDVDFYDDGVITRYGEVNGVVHEAQDARKCVIS